MDTPRGRKLCRTAWRCLSLRACEQVAGEGSKENGGLSRGIVLPFGMIRRGGYSCLRFNRPTEYGPKPLFIF